MLRRSIDPELIDHRDANAKILVWFVEGDKRTLYGMRRLARDHGISYHTFRARWIMAGRPDEVFPALLVDPAESYSMGRRPVANVQPAKYEPDRCYTLMPDNTNHTATELGQMFDVPVSTLATRKKKGVTTFTREELDLMKRRGKTLKVKKGLEKYTHPSFRPDVPWGDLAHLSNSVNTGAARVGCERWDRLNPHGIGDATGPDRCFL